MTSTPLPPRNAKRFHTACQFCIVGCGYRVFKWPEGSDGGPAPNDNALNLDFRQQQPALGTWIAPAMQTVVTDRDGTRQNITIIPDKFCQVNSGLESVRGGGLASTLYRPDGPTRMRLSTPGVRNGTTLELAAWNDATDLAARVIKAVIDRWGAEAVGMKFFDHGGGGGGFENNWAVGRFFFEAVKTTSCSIHNRPAYNSEVHAAGDAGIAPLTNAYIDAQLADTILVVGANPYETQTNYFLNHMVKNLNGETMSLKKRIFSDEEIAPGRMIIIDPRRTMSVAAAEVAAGAQNVLHLQIEPGTDIWVLNAIARIIIDRRWHDVGFITGFTEMQTFNAYQRSSLMRDRPADEVINEAAGKAGIPVKLLKKAADWIARPKAGRARRRTLLHYEKGLIWGLKNYENVASIVDLGLLTGNIGKPGTGISRLGGHQEGYVRPPSLGGRPARNIDEKLRRGEIKLFWVGGCNPVLTTLDAATIGRTLEERGQLVTEALATSIDLPVEQRVIAIVEALKAGGVFTIAQDIYPTKTAERAHLVLPAAGWGETNLTSINGERRLRLHQKFMDPPGEALPDWQIIAHVAQRLNALYTADRNPEMANRFLDFDWRDEEAVFIDARYSFKGGPDEAMEGYAGIDYDLLRKLGTNGIQTPVRLVRGTPVGTERLYEDKRFSTKSGKAKFIPAPPPWPGYAAPVMRQRKKYSFWINNGRSNHLWQTVYHHRYLKFYRERAPIPYVEMHPGDAAKLNIDPGDIVEVINDRGTVQAMAYPTGAVKPGHCFLLFGQPRGPAGNLVSDHVDPKTTIPWYKGVWADIRRIGPMPELTRTVTFKPQNIAQ